jgi:hypothetical protein
MYMEGTQLDKLQARAIECEGYLKKLQGIRMTLDGVCSPPPLPSLPSCVTAKTYEAGAGRGAAACLVAAGKALRIMKTRPDELFLPDVGISSNE